MTENEQTQDDNVQKRKDALCKLLNDEVNRFRTSLEESPFLNNPDSKIIEALTGMYQQMLINHIAKAMVEPKK